MPLRALHIVIFVVVLGSMVYLPGLGGDYVYDDYTNIVQNLALRPDSLSLNSILAAAVSSDSGPLNRPLASLSFLANFHFFGVSPLSFKITNLFIHVLNGCLVFYLLLRVLPRISGPRANVSAIAGLTAIVWTVHPFNLTGVLYIVQRMTSLAATFTLAAIICYLVARERAITCQPGRQFPAWTGVVTFGILGLATKESALLLPVFLVLIELTTYRFRAAKHLKWVYGIGIFVGLGGLWYLLGPLDFFAEAYRERPFNAVERTLTESRILIFYLAQILLPDPTRMALLHPDWTLSTNLWTPWTTLVAVGFWLFSVVISFVALRPYPVVTFGIGWFLVGHLMESTFVPLELIYEHRNYLPSIGVLCLASVGIVHLANLRPAAGRAVIGGVIAILCAMTAYRSWQWSEPFTLAFSEARHNPTSARTRYEYGRQQFQLYLSGGNPELLRKSRRELWAAIRYGNEDFHPLVGLINSYVLSRELVPEKLMKAFERELREETPNPRRLDAVFVAINCQMSHACPLAPNVVLRAVAATLANPRLPPALKAKMLEWLALYYSNSLGDLAAARSVMQEGVSVQPKDWMYRLRLAEVMAAQQDWPAARIEFGKLTPAVTSWVRITEPIPVKRFDELRAKLAVKNPPESDVR